MLGVKTYVLHVKKGYEEREQHIRTMLNKFGIDFEFILDGDIPDLSKDILEKYFTGIMKQQSAQASCAMKHLLALEHIVKNNLPGALVLEDDMILYNNFVSVFSECLKEIKTKDIKNPLISFEDSTLHFVPRSQRIRGQYLYPAKEGRFAGCIYYSKGCADMILNYVKENKCDLPIDLFEKELVGRIGIPIYWSHPCIATQGSHTGLFKSSIDEKSARKQNYRAWTWKIKLLYKKSLYFLR